MSQNLTVEKSSPSPLERTESNTSQPAFAARETLRVRDLTGEIVLSPGVGSRSAARPAAHPVVVTPAQRGGKLTLSWYDYGVVALVVASMVAGVICLLHGV